MGRFTRSYLTIALLMMLCASSLPGANTYTAQAQATPIFSDGFESGNLSQWTAVSGLAVQQQVVHTGTWAARATSTGVAAYSNKLISPSRTELFYRIKFILLSKTTTQNLLKFRGVGSTGGSS